MHRGRSGVLGEGGGDLFKVGVFYLYVIKKDGIIVYVLKKFDLSSVSKLENFFSHAILSIYSTNGVKCGW